MIDKNVWQLAQSSLSRDMSVVMLIVAEADGHTPGKPGFMMLIAEDGTFAGTVGGGGMEFDLVEEAKHMLSERRYSPSVRKGLLAHDADPEDNHGMVCSGTQTIIVYPLLPKNLVAIEDILSTIERRGLGVVCFTPQEMVFEPGPSRIDRVMFEYRDENTWEYDARIGATDTVYIFGGGHVGLALSKVLASLSFDVVVFDDRPDVVSLRDNAYADEKIVTPFSEVSKYISTSGSSYAVIMTHAADLVVLRQIINMPLRYLGMMGSREKAEVVYDRLRAEGVSDTAIDRVRCPVGLPIYSDTPAEIAISVAAELIKVRKESLTEKALSAMPP